MLRSIIGLLLLAACSNGAIKSGGQGVYTYHPAKEYTADELKLLAPEVVVTSKRDPSVGKLDELFSKKQAPLKRIGIIVFETQLQPTRSGLSGEDAVYLSESGKQLFTEKLLHIWEQVMTTLAPDIDYVSINKVKKSKALHRFGSGVEDYIKTRRDAIDPDDIFYLEKGKYTTATTTLNPRGMQDVSFVLVPANELMQGPKWSEHNKQFLNEVAKELKLDAVLIIMSEIWWTTAHQDKHSGEVIPEGVNLKLMSTTLVSLSEYRKRAEKLNLTDVPSVSLCYRSYETRLHFPATITVPAEEQTFDTLVRNLIRPTLKSYIDLSIMMVHQMTEDLKKTY